MVPLQPPAAAAPAQVATPPTLRHLPAPSPPSHPFLCPPFRSPPSLPSLRAPALSPSPPCARPPPAARPSQDPSITPAPRPSQDPSIARPLPLLWHHLRSLRPALPPLAGAPAEHAYPPSPHDPHPRPPRALSQRRTGALRVGPAGAAVRARGAPSRGTPGALLRRGRAVPRGLRPLRGRLHLHPGEPGESPERAVGARPSRPCWRPPLPASSSPLRAAHAPRCAVGTLGQALSCLSIPRLWAGAPRLRFDWGTAPEPMILDSK